MNVLENATAAIEKERQIGYITGGKVNSQVVEMDSIPEELVIIGDIHGDLQSLLWVLKDIDFETRLTNPNNKLIFLGDYVDRGSNSIGIVRIPKQLLIVHGGLPTGDDLILSIRSRNTLGSAVHDPFIDSTDMEEILWNDPMEQIDNGLDWEYSRRGYGKHFAITVSERWLEASSSKLVIRGHEPCQGFKINHHGMILTLFSCKEAYPGFQAAYIRITREQLQNLHDGPEFVPYIKKVP